MKNKIFYLVNFDNYNGDGTVCSFAADENDPQIKRERGGVLVFTDKKSGFSRVIYETKKDAESVLYSMICD